MREGGVGAVITLGALVVWCTAAATAGAAAAVVVMPLV